MFPCCIDNWISVFKRNPTRSLRLRSQDWMTPPSNPQVTPQVDTRLNAIKGSSRGIMGSFFASRTLLSSSISLYSYFSHRKVNFHIFHSHVKIIRGEVTYTIVLLEKIVRRNVLQNTTTRSTKWVGERKLLTRVSGSR